MRPTRGRPVIEAWALINSLPQISCHLFLLSLHTTKPLKVQNWAKLQRIKLYEKNHRGFVVLVNTRTYKENVIIWNHLHFEFTVQDLTWNKGIKCFKMFKIQHFTVKLLLFLPTGTLSTLMCDITVTKRWGKQGVQKENKVRGEKRHWKTRKYLVSKVSTEHDVHFDK